MRLRLLALSLVLAGIALAGSPDRFAYVFKRGNDSIMRVNGSIERYLHIKDRWSGEFIYVEHGGRKYLLRDPAVLAEAARAFAHMEALEPQLRAAEAKLRPIEKKYERLEERADDLSDRGETDAALEEQLRAMESEYRAAEQAVERLDEEMERREEIAEKKFDAIVMRAIGAGKAERVK